MGYIKKKKKKVQSVEETYFILAFIFSLHCK